MNTISNILYWISTGLLVPVIVLLIFLFIRALILIGGFFSRYLQMKKTTAVLYGNISSLSADTFDDFEKKLAAVPAGDVKNYARRIIEAGDNVARCELLLSEYEITADKSLSTPRMLTKMGPMLGLMGTLIPMGPALVGLSTGDIASMAYNMQVAFATTVVGLVIAAVGLVTLQVQERWFAKNLTILEYIADVVKLSNSSKSCGHVDATC